MEVRDKRVAQVGRLVLRPGYTYMVIFDNRHSRFSSSHIKYEIRIEKKSKKLPNINTRRYSQLSTGSKRTEMVLLVKEILAKDCLRKKLTIEEDRPPSQLSASLSTSGFLVPRLSSPSLEVSVHVHRSNSFNGNQSRHLNLGTGNEHPDPDSMLEVSN